ncbi:MAG: hypothetical protein QM504_06740 [Pseudomonadota bacterium]
MNLELDKYAYDVKYNENIEQQAWCDFVVGNSKNLTNIEFSRSIATIMIGHNEINIKGLDNSIIFLEGLLVSGFLEHTYFNLIEHIKNEYSDISDFFNLKGLTTNGVLELVLSSSGVKDNIFQIDNGFNNGFLHFIENKYFNESQWERLISNYIDSPAELKDMKCVAEIQVNHLDFSINNVAIAKSLLNLIDSDQSYRHFNDSPSLLAFESLNIRNDEYIMLKGHRAASGFVLHVEDKTFRLDVFDDEPILIDDGLFSASDWSVAADFGESVNTSEKDAVSDVGDIAHLDDVLKTEDVTFFNECERLCKIDDFNTKVEFIIKNHDKDIGLVLSNLLNSINDDELKGLVRLLDKINNTSFPNDSEEGLKSMLSNLIESANSMKIGDFSDLKATVISNENIGKDAIIDFIINSALDKYPRPEARNALLSLIKNGAIDVNRVLNDLQSTEHNFNVGHLVPELGKMPGVDVDSLHEYVCENCLSHEIYNFAKEVKNSNLSTLRDPLIRVGASFFVELIDDLALLRDQERMIESRTMDLVNLSLNLNTVVDEYPVTEKVIDFNTLQVIVTKHNNELYEQEQPEREALSHE